MDTAQYEDLPPSLFRWIWIPGAAGLITGFCGPMIFNPDSNLGPLLGIFFSGPGGLALGLALGLLCRLLKIAPQRQWLTLTVSCAALTVVTLFYCLPGPKLQGYLVDVQVDGCTQPAQKVDAAIEYWNKRIATVTWAAPRAGWQEEARATAQADKGVVLDVTVLRKKEIEEQRKPWNRGRMTAKAWLPMSEKKSYYKDGDCTYYPVGTHAVHYTPYDISALTSGTTDWPPKKLPDFLDLAVLRPVPDEYRDFANNPLP